MKKLLLAMLVCTEAATGHPQGTVLFANYSQQGQGVNAPVYESDGVTPLSGPQFMAELFAGPSAASLASLATTGFLTGGVGVFNGGPVTVNAVAPAATAWIEVVVWNTGSGATFAQAKASGLPNSWWASATFPLVLGGGSINPEPPAVLTGLGTSPLYLNSVPEPSVLALVGLGMAVMLLRIRRRGLRPD